MKRLALNTFNHRKLIGIAFISMMFAVDYLGSGRCLDKRPVSKMCFSVDLISNNFLHNFFRHYWMMNTAYEDLRARDRYYKTFLPYNH